MSLPQITRTRVYVETLVPSYRVGRTWRNGLFDPGRAKWCPEPYQFGDRFFELMPPDFPYWHQWNRDRQTPNLIRVIQPAPCDLPHTGPCNVACGY